MRELEKLLTVSLIRHPSVEVPSYVRYSSVRRTVTALLLWET